MLVAVVRPFGELALVVGPETYLAERAVAELIATAREAEPSATITSAIAADLDRGQVMEMTGGALLSAETVAVIWGFESARAEIAETVRSVAADLPPETALVVVHAGGAKGKAALDALRPLAARVIDAPAIKTWDLPKFATAEARRRGATLDSEAAQRLVEAVGSDARAISAAVEQLAMDAPGAALTSAHIHRYFAGRAEVTSFAVADDVMAGRDAAALEKLRWAMSTGVAPVLITSALANSLRQLGKYADAAGGRRPEAAIAKDVGVPPWKIKDLARQARGWSPEAVGTAIKEVARADGDVKGAATDPEYALERLLAALAACRESAKQR